MGTGDASRTVLVADDDASVRRVFGRVLERAGFAVCLAGDGDEALDLIGRVRPDLVLLDSRMPRLDGISTLARIRAEPETRTLPVLMVTGHGDLPDRVRSLDTGASDFLTKPVHPDELVARVRAQLRGSDAWREAVQQSWADRAEVVDTIRRIASDPSIEDAADAVCEALVGMAGVAGASILGFRRDDVVVLGRRGFERLSPRRSLGRGTALAIMRRVEEGPWSEDDAMRVKPRGRSVPAAFAPLVHSGAVIGVLVLVRTADDPPSSSGHALATAIDLAPAVAEVIAARSVGGIDAVARRAQIQSVIHRRAFRTVFEPVARLDDRSVVGYEALTRFTDGGPPDRWFRDAAWVGLGTELEDATLALAAERCRALPADTYVSLNVSARQLESGPSLRSLVERAGRPVVLELTERDRVEDYEAVRRTLRSLGDVQLAVDDAGAGYASLRHILALEPALIKLDASWVHDLAGDPARRALVEGLARFADVAGAAIVAEGVEREADAEAVAAIGARYAQGRLFGGVIDLDG